MSKEAKKPTLLFELFSNGFLKCSPYNNRSLQSNTTAFNSYSYRLILGLHVSTLGGSSSGPNNNIDPNILFYKYVVGSPTFTDQSIS